MILSPLAVLVAFGVLLADPVTEPPVPFPVGSPAGDAVERGERIRIDRESLHADVRVLASDSLEGRLVGSEGGARARRYLAGRLAELGVRPLAEAGVADAPPGYEREFVARLGSDNEPVRGRNLVGWVPGTEDGPVLVLTAHYDHLGIRDGEIYHGADDNASGVAGVLAIAELLLASPLRSDVVVALLDGEEGGLRGARAFVGEETFPLERIALNVNLDMVGRNEADELYVAGTWHTPELLPLVEEIAATAPVTLLVGHDQPNGAAGQDWTRSSDHGAFHEVGIPFLYFGVEDHPDYHRPTDTSDRIDPDFHARAVETALRVIEAYDRSPPDIAQRVP